MAGYCSDGRTSPISIHVPREGDDSKLIYYKEYQKTTKTQQISFIVLLAGKKNMVLLMAHQALPLLKDTAGAIPILVEDQCTAGELVLEELKKAGY